MAKFACCQLAGTFKKTHLYVINTNICSTVYDDNIPDVACNDLNLIPSVYTGLYLHNVSQRVSL